MRSTRIILLTILLMGVLGISLTLFPIQRTKVFGKLPANDLGEISQVIHKDLRRYELPTFSKENLQYPHYVMSSIKQYAARRILWVDVRDERTVRVFVGDSKETIASDGWAYTLLKDSSWRICGTAYWRAASLAPQDFKVPPGL